jgi:hypothetical protein
MNWWWPQGSFVESPSLHFLLSFLFLPSVFFLCVLPDLVLSGAWCSSNKKSSWFLGMGCNASGKKNMNYWYMSSCSQRAVPNQVPDLIFVVAIQLCKACWINKLTYQIRLLITTRKLTKQNLSFICFKLIFEGWEKSKKQALWTNMDQWYNISARLHACLINKNAQIELDVPWPI